MATEHEVAPKSELSDRGVVIENEIPAYRAIEPAAVISLICGLASALCFADVRFVVAAVAAVALGAWADWKIRRLPEVYTGRGMAQAGIAMGIIFSLSSVTIGYVQSAVLNREALAFAKRYVGVLKTGKLADAVWYRIPPDERRTTTPEELLRKMSQGSSDPMALEAHLGTTKGLIKRIKEGADVHVESIENSGYEDLTKVANVLLKVGGPGPVDPKHPELGYSLIQVRSNPGQKVAGWYLHELFYPYTPKTLPLATSKPKDDGHGHSH